TPWCAANLGASARLRSHFGREPRRPGALFSLNSRCVASLIRPATSTAPMPRCRPSRTAPCL
ncbi:hypothetical protein BJY59DRAFT_695712, partial [Rhodotorula toruloides]